MFYMFLKNQPRFYMVARLYGNEGENKVFPGSSDSKESACNAEDLGLSSGSGGYPGEGNGYPLQYSCLKNSMDMEEPGRLQSMGSQRVRHD